MNFHDFNSIFLLKIFIFESASERFLLQQKYPKMFIIYYYNYYNYLHHLHYFLHIFIISSSYFHISSYTFLSPIFISSLSLSLSSFSLSLFCFFLVAGLKCKKLTENCDFGVPGIVLRLSWQEDLPFKVSSRLLRGRPAICARTSSSREFTF